MYTGYFANLKEYHKHYLIPVSIALWTPKWFRKANIECAEFQP